MTMRDDLRAPTGKIALSRFDTAGGDAVPGKKVRKQASKLASLQERLWAESTAGGTRSVLLVLQGMDTAGKGGTTEHVVGACGPIGVQYTGFKKPTREELEHHFLWRIEKHVPPAGVIGVFDRSHYEDVLVVRVHDLVPPDEWEGRYDEINAFEARLASQGTTIVKCFLHISAQTQRDRLLARLDTPDKHWKFNAADLDERAYWDDYAVAYEALLERCNTDAAPWYIVPSDDKAYRNWAVGEILRETLDELDPHYPRPDLDVAALRERLGA